MDRRKMLAMLGLSPALVAGSPAYARTAVKAVPDSSAGDGLITVLNPGIPNKLATRYPLAPPLDNLENKTRLANRSSAKSQSRDREARKSPYRAFWYGAGVSVDNEK